MELAKVEALASGHRADFERERERADALMAELLKMTADAMAPRKRRLGSKVARSGCVRNYQTSIPTAMPGAQRCSALSLLSTGVMSASACRGGSGLPGGRPTTSRLLRQRREK
jgi:hypothetical protein